MNPEKEYPYFDYLINTDEMDEYYSFKEIRKGEHLLVIISDIAQIKKDNIDMYNEAIHKKGERWVNVQFDRLKENIYQLKKIIDHKYPINITNSDKNIRSIFNIYNQYVASHVERIFNGKRVPILGEIELNDIYHYYLKI